MARIAADFNAFISHITDAAPEALKLALEPTFRASQEQVPVDTGALKDSGYLEIVRRGKNSVVEIGYGRNGFPDYAAVVHEDTTVPHKSPTKAKFLEDPLHKDYFKILDRTVQLMRLAGGM
jgi:hypothetical protein